MSTHLESRLRHAGLSCRVEARERMALVIPATTTLIAPGDRHRILQLARGEGFTHVAVELDPDGAALPGD